MSTTATSKTAKVKAATEEVAAAPAPKTIEWRGVSFTLEHDELPADIVWVLADIETGQIKPMIEFFDIILGADQVALVRQKLRDDQVTLQDAPDALGELLVQINEAYGMAEGDSDASQ